MSIFDWSARRLEAIRIIEENGGIIDDTTEKAIQDLEENDNEARFLIKYYRDSIIETNNEINLLKDEIDRLKEKIKARENYVNRIKDNLKLLVEAIGDINSKTGYKYYEDPNKTFKVSIVKHHIPKLIIDESRLNTIIEMYPLKNITIKDKNRNNDIIKILEDNKIPYDIKVDLNKEGLIKDLNEGTMIAGAYLEENTYIKLT